MLLFYCFMFSIKRKKKTFGKKDCLYSVDRPPVISRQFRNYRVRDWHILRSSNVSIFKDEII